jgi:hypothetical protein
MKIEELVRLIPELKHLERAKNQDPLPQILERTGATVAAFFDNFPNTACAERVTSMVADPFRADAYHLDAKYNYLALAEAGAGTGRLHEFRTDDKGSVVQPDPRTSVVTAGFVAMSAHFHPEFQPDSRFHYLGRQVIGEQGAYVVAFAQRPTVARQVTEIRFPGVDEIVFWQGLAWIDPVSFRILRLRTDMQPPPGHVGVLKTTIQIEYSEVSFIKGGKTLWLPRDVTVNGQLDKYTFYNRHHYSDYRLFHVEVEQKHN